MTLSTHRELLEEVWKLIQKRKIVLENGCEILRFKSNDKYSGFWFNRRNWKASRVAAALFYDLNYDNPEEHACHTTECTTKRCCKIEHIYKGNRSLNATDRYTLKRPGRKAVCKECNAPISKTRVISMALCKPCYKIYHTKKRIARERLRCD